MGYEAFADKDTAIHPLRKCSEKYVIMQYNHYLTIIECIYTNLDGVGY